MSGGSASNNPHAAVEYGCGGLVAAGKSGQSRNASPRDAILGRPYVIFAGARVPSTDHPEQIVECECLGSPASTEGRESRGLRPVGAIGGVPDICHRTCAVYASY